MDSEKSGIRARKSTTDVVEGIAITTSYTPIRKDRRPPLRRENALPPCAPNAKRSRNVRPIRRRVLRFAGAPQASSHRRRTDASQWITAAEKRSRQASSHRTQKNKQAPPSALRASRRAPPQVRKRRRRDTQDAGCKRRLAVGGLVCRLLLVLLHRVRCGVRAARRMR